MKQVEFRLITGNWYEFTLSDDSKLIVQFKGDDNRGIVLIGCDGEQKVFVPFKAVCDLGNENPC